MLTAGSRVCLLACGSFNPPTIMHLRMLEVARDHLRSLSCVVLDGIFSPVADTFGKANLAPAHHRFEMVKAGVSTSDWMTSDDWECTQPAWSRTVAVLSFHLEQLRKKHGDDIRLMLVVGGDVVDSFPRILPNGEPLWMDHDVKRIVDEFGLIVISRDGSDPLGTLRSMPILQDVAHNVQIIKDVTCPCAVSSTLIRSAVKDGKSIKFATPDPVIDYIRKYNLYC